MNEAQDIECVLVHCEHMGDWYRLERAEHDGQERFVRVEEDGFTYSCLHLSCRLEPTTCYEGTAAEWRAIAADIERDESDDFRRCAAIRTEQGYEFSSPRNSISPTLLTVDAAKRVAAAIRKAIPDTSSPTAPVDTSTAGTAGSGRLPPSGLTEEPWEDLDCSRRMWGVFDANGYSAEPIALFTSKQSANEWLDWDKSRGDDATVWCEPCVCPVDKLTGRVWNSTEDPPEEAP